MILPMIGAMVVGLSLGLLGAGGSILTVPTLIYLVGQEEKLAIASSLFVVGCISVGGAIFSSKKKLVDQRSVLLFAPPGMAGTWLGAAISGHITGTAQLVLFALIMLLVSILMIRPRQNSAGPAKKKWNLKVSLGAAGAGIITGIVGVGGGFLIIPALVLLGGLEMNRAVGTSLVIIALNSFAGFIKHMDVLAAHNLALDWNLMVCFASVGIIGSITGMTFGTRLPQQTLRRAFGVLLIFMAGFVLTTQLSHQDKPVEPQSISKGETK